MRKGNELLRTKKGDEGFEGDELRSEALKLSYFKICNGVKEIGYLGVLEIWYDFAGTLKELINDSGAIELLNWSKTKGKVHLYIFYHIFQPDIVDVVDVQLVLTYLQPTEQQTEGQPDIPDTDTLPKIPDIDTLLEIPKQNAKKNGSGLNEQRDDSALGCKFDDSDDEVLNDGIDEVFVGV
ncbi:hypothetical protein KIW84_034358 [Lathyrus oleraceus]|uniref:PB1-like domain-containing protein n=1 Tax=Pisum sativum TaxID=3888 RepID=A0A9D5B4F8_PEA|nr:hypothetical protein KIW84_034358 [Pisum sativum]